MAPLALKCLQFSKLFIKINIKININYLDKFLGNVFLLIAVQLF